LLLYTKDWSKIPAIRHGNRKRKKKTGRKTKQKREGCRKKTEIGKKVGTSMLY
jgi:hypothetical protein